MSKEINLSSKRTSLREKKKDITRKAILTEAEKILSEKLLNEINTGEIADAAIVSRTTIYNYFKSKDEIFFGLGTQHFIEINESFDSNLPTDITSIQQVLIICEAIIKGSFEKPVLFRILREFFNRINYNNLPIEDMYAKILTNVGTNSYESILDEFKEPYLIEFFLQLIRFEEKFRKIIQKGKQDGLIKNSLPNEHLTHFIFILVNGILDELDLRRSTFKRIGMDKQVVIDNTLNLISIFLTHKSYYNRWETHNDNVNSKS